MKEIVAGIPLAQFAAMTAALAEAFPLRAVLAIEQIGAPAWAEADRGWTERLDQDRELLARYEAEVVAAQARMCAGGKAKLTRWGSGLKEDPSGASASTAAAPSFLTARPSYVTAPDLDPPDDEDPFVQTGKAYGGAAAALPFAPAPARPPQHTQVALESSSAALPFQPLQPPDPVRRPAADEERTLAAFELPRQPQSKEPLPFQPADPGRSTLTAMPAPRPSRAPSSGETQAIRVAPGELPAIRGSAAETQAIRVASAGFPFQSPQPSVDDGGRSSAAPPPPQPSLDEPRLSLEQHAHMCLEIALDPSRTAEVLARYNVTPEQRSRVDAHYRAEINADPDLGARWNHAYTSYHAWFTSSSRA